MDVLTANDARALAASLSQLAGALDNCRFANWDALTEVQRHAMRIDAQDIRTYANRLIQKAIGLTINDLKGTMSGLSDATKWIHDAAANLGSLDKAIAIGAAAVEIAAAGAAANPSALGDAVGDFLTAVAKAIPSVTT